MKTSATDALSQPGIISVPSAGDADAMPLAPYSIRAVPDIRQYMQEKNMDEAFVIYLDTYDEALRFRDELYDTME